MTKDHHVQLRILIAPIDNDFDGQVYTEQGRCRSVKREGFGAGIISI